MKIVLASQSAGRKQLLTSLGLKFDTIPADANELAIQDPKPSVRAKKIAKLKAETIYEKHFKNVKEDFLIIAGDSFVYHRGTFIGKPLTQDHAKEILNKLSATAHFLYSGVFLILQRQGKITRISFYDKSKVIFKKLTEQEIHDFVRKVNVLKFAGSYNIEGYAEGKSLIRKIVGSKNNVIGLPVEKLKKELIQLKVLI